jgi:hypothetical protein
MGWWSTDILGGDTPLDWEDEFYGISKVDKFGGAEKGKINYIPKDVLEQRQFEFSDLLDAASNYTEPGIGYQVLAVMMMRAGASIDPVVKGKMVAAALGDQWAKEDSEREETIHGLVKALSQYDGQTPILVKSKGLLEVMAEKLSSEKENNN